MNNTQLLSKKTKRRLLRSHECCYLLYSKAKQQTPVGADLTFQSRNIPPRQLFLVLPSAGRSTLSAQPSKEETLTMAANTKVKQAEAAVHALFLLLYIQ